MRDRMGKPVAIYYVRGPRSGRDYPVLVVRRNGNGATVRIDKRSEEIRLGVPPTVSRRWVEDTVLRYGESWGRRMDEAPLPAPSAFEITLGREMILGGKSVPIRIEQGQKARGCETEEGIVLYLLRPEDREEGRRVLDRWFSAKAKFEIPIVYKRWHEIMFPGSPLPALTIRRMRSRWGSCNAAKRRITLNEYLLKVPPACLDYIVVHELAHLVHANHGSDFYRLVGQYIPDWKERRKLLRGFE